MLTTAERGARAAGAVTTSDHRQFATTAGGGTRPAAGRRRLHVQRILNIFVALLGLVLTSPLMLLIALAIKLTSPGPVLYTQTRVGLNRRRNQGGNWRRTIDYGGRLFTIYKFRTMQWQAEPVEAQVWAQPNDVRVTRIGGVLRKYRLDELPQLVNVLKGDMNVVGPRPEQPKIFLELRDQIAHYPDRQRVLPGITGRAQVNQQYDRDVEDVRRKLQFDLDYAARVSALEDLRIMLQTIPVVLFRRGGW